jgi:carbohydrate-binding DOMON domain-containing protein
MPSPSRSSRFRSAVSWVALAVLGLVVAAVVSLAASRLSSQHIGLSSEPLTAGERLTPAEVPTSRGQSPRAKQTSTTATSPTTPTTTQPAEHDSSARPDEPDSRRDSDDD